MAMAGREAQHLTESLKRAVVRVISICPKATGTRLEWEN